MKPTDPPIEGASRQIATRWTKGGASTIIVAADFTGAQPGTWNAYVSDQAGTRNHIGQFTVRGALPEIRHIVPNPATVEDLAEPVTILGTGFFPDVTSINGEPVEKALGQVTTTIVDDNRSDLTVLFAQIRVDKSPTKESKIRVTVSNHYGSSKPFELAVAPKG
jgi:hypothetical protein